MIPSQSLYYIIVNNNVNMIIVQELLIVNTYNLLAGFLCLPDF